VKFCEFGQHVAHLVTNDFLVILRTVLGGMGASSWELTDSNISTMLRGIYSARLQDKELLYLFSLLKCFYFYYFDLPLRICLFFPSFYIRTSAYVFKLLIQKI
jgi:hypothetical protein